MSRSSPHQPEPSGTASYRLVSTHHARSEKEYQSMCWYTGAHHTISNQQHISTVLILQTLPKRSYCNHHSQLYLNVLYQKKFSSWSKVVVHHHQCDPFQYPHHELQLCQISSTSTSDHGLYRNMLAQIFYHQQRRTAPGRGAGGGPLIFFL